MEAEAALSGVNSFREVCRYTAAQRAGERRTVGAACHRARGFLAAYPDIEMKIIADDTFVDAQAE